MFVIGLFLYFRIVIFFSLVSRLKREAAALVWWATLPSLDYSFPVLFMSIAMVIYSTATAAMIKNSAISHLTLNRKISFSENTPADGRLHIYFISSS